MHQYFCVHIYIHDAYIHIHTYVHMHICLYHIFLTFYKGFTSFVLFCIFLLFFLSCFFFISHTHPFSYPQTQRLSLSLSLSFPLSNPRYALSLSSTAHMCSCYYVYVCASHSCIYGITPYMYSYYHMGWLRSVGSFKLQASFAEYRLFYRALLQKRPIILRSLLIIATPYTYMVSCAFMVLLVSFT